MESKIKKIIVILMLVLIQMFAMVTTSQATNVKDIISQGSNAIGKKLGPIGRDPGVGNADYLEGSGRSPYLYCIQKYKLLQNKNTYKVAKYIEIDGNIAKIYSNSEKYKLYTNSDNAVIAYILGGGKEEKGFGNNNNGGARQNALWAFWNTWAEKALGGYTWAENSGEKNQVYNEAQNYAKNLNNKKDYTAQIKSANSTVKSVGTLDNSQLIGPIKLTFTGTLSVENSDGLEFYDSNKNKLSGIKDIKSKQSFYIKNTKNNKISTLKFKTTASNSENIKAKIWIIKNVKSGNPTQRLIMADANPSTTKTEATVEIKVEHESEGNLKIHKQDSSKGSALAGAEFKIYIEKEKKWLGTDKTGAYIYNASYENAKTFTTNKDGNITINNLKAGITIRVYETKAPEGYDLSVQAGYDKETKRVYCNQRTYKINKTPDVSVTMKNSKTGNLEITKLDSITKDQLSGAGFKISAKVEGNKSKNTWIKQNNDGTHSYTSSFADATTFTSNSKGIVKVENLDPAVYYVYEVKAPKGYDITVQENYEKQNEWVKCGKVDVTAGNTIKVNQNNEKLISVEGYVWIEKPLTKDNEPNDKFDNEESIITDKVTITLRNKSDDSIVAKDPKIVTEKVNNTEVACYRFEKINYNKLKDYYVHFDYSKEYKEYITVTSDFTIAEGSKALSDNVPTYDKDLVGMATTYKKSANEADYGLSGLATKFYDEKTYTLKNINLGIKPLPETPFTVSESMAYIEVKIKGYTYRYNYGGSGEKLQTVPLVKFQSETDKECYTRDIYPADITYSDAEKTKNLQVYATYRIDVTNNTQIDVPSLYQEKYLNVLNVTNKYDTGRYELADKNWADSNKSGIATINADYLQKQYYEDYSAGNGITKENEKNSKASYITFKVNEDKVKELLTSKTGSVEDFPTTATVTANHKYTRKDSSWENNITKEQTHFTKEQTQQDDAPYLWLKLGDNRTISGKVFEDKNSTSNGELVGDGIYEESKESKVSGVKVELGNYDGNAFIPTNLYQVDKDGNTVLENGKYPVASTVTSNDGTYSFVGVVPGVYYLRYTYGDGKQIILNADNTVVSPYKYKSTIVTDAIRKAFETKYEDETKATWYIGLEGNHNLAVDNLNRRKELSANTYSATNSVVKALNDTSKLNKDTTITAETPVISIPVEFDTEGESSVAIENDGKTITKQYPNELGYMDFGIIETPKTSLDVAKKITNIKLTLQNGQVMAEGNPATQNVNYATDLDRKTEGGSTYVKVELNNEYIYGSTLEVRYEIAITNNSDVDYIEAENDNHYGNYYKYGDKTYAKEKSIKLDKVYDYLDPKLSYLSAENEGNVKLVDISKIENQVKDAGTSETDKIALNEILDLVQVQSESTGLTYNKILEITGYNGELYSSKGEKKDQSTKTTVINANKILSTGEDDLEFINTAQVVGITTQQVTSPNIESLPTSKKVTLTVTPSTGANRSVIYFVIGAISLLVVAGAIFVIKKKSLGNKE